MSLKNTVTPSLSPTNDPWLLTPGPLTTSPTVKQAMLHDYGSRDHGFIGVNKRMRERLLEITRRMFDIEQQALDLLSETRTLRAGTLRIVGTDKTLDLKAIAKRAAQIAEKKVIERVLAQTRWNRKEAAERLQISYKALLYKMKENGLSDDR